MFPLYRKKCLYLWPVWHNKHVSTAAPSDSASLCIVPSRLKPVWGGNNKKVQSSWTISARWNREKIYCKVRENLDVENEICQPKTIVIKPKGSYSATPLVYHCSLWSLLPRCGRLSWSCDVHWGPSSCHGWRGFNFVYFLTTYLCGASGKVTMKWVQNYLPSGHCF